VTSESACNSQWLRCFSRLWRFAVRPAKSQVAPFKSRQNRNLLRNLFGSRTYTERNDDETVMASEKKMIFLRGSPCGRTGARKSLEGKRRESSSQGWVGDQQTVVALKWNEAKAAEWRITQGRRLSTVIVRSLPAHHRVSHAGSGWYGGGGGSARTGGRGKRVVWRSGVSWRERSEGALIRREYGRDLRGAGLRAMRPRIGPRALTHGSGGAVLATAVAWRSRASARRGLSERS